MTEITDSDYAVLIQMLKRVVPNTSVSDITADITAKNLAIKNNKNPISFK